ncbi:hypothetical protein J4443_02900 [Candidatus Woesearchaeota archaeon]|nr:hypothetical protein [Candidatus Woesearchaeota archaeon]
MKRKKRTLKSIDSLTERIREHEEKLKAAKERGKEDLVDYYEKEISSLREAKERKMRIIDR